jgi:hypothetical protein
MLHFLHRCRQRLDQRGFDHRGGFYQAIDKAHRAVHALHVELHYMSCESGVWGANEDRPNVTAHLDEGQAPPNLTDA